MAVLHLAILSWLPKSTSSSMCLMSPKSKKVGISESFRTWNSTTHQRSMSKSLITTKNCQPSAYKTSAVQTKKKPVGMLLARPFHGNSVPSKSKLSRVQLKPTHLCRWHTKVAYHRLKARNTPSLTIQIWKFRKAKMSLSKKKITRLSAFKN